MDNFVGHYVKLSKLVTHTHTQIVGFHLYEVPRRVKFIKTENRIVVVRSWGKGTRGS